MKKSFVFLTALTLGMTSLVQAGKERPPEELLDDYSKSGTILKERRQKHHILVGAYMKKFDSLTFSSTPSSTYASLLDLEKALDACNKAQLLLVNAQKEVENLNHPTYQTFLERFEEEKKRVAVAEKSYKKHMGALKSLGAK